MCLAPCFAASSGRSASWYVLQLLSFIQTSLHFLTHHVNTSLADTCIPRGLVGAGLPAAKGDSCGHLRGYQSCTPEPLRPQAPAPGHPPAADHPASLVAGRPGLPCVQQHRALPLPRYEGGDGKDFHHANLSMWGSLPRNPIIQMTSPCQLTYLKVGFSGVGYPALELCQSCAGT